MGATSTVTKENNLETLIDDISSFNEMNVDNNKLAALKEKSKAKQQENKMSAKIVGKKEKSLNLGVIGSGQCGSAISSEFYKLGYPAIACNTAIQDLKFIDMPDSNKLLLEYTLGGASKELAIGKAAAEANRGEILQLINEKLSDSQVNILCLSLGGGSGSGSAETLVDICTSLEKPLVVMAVLPMSTEDAQSKSNALETLSKLSKLTQSKKINNLIVVDNAKIESIFANVSQTDFYRLANKSIVETIDIFNTLSSMPSATKGLDPMEFSKLLIDSEGLTTYGSMIIKNYEDDTAIAEGIINNLSENLLTEGFDLKQSKYVGFIVTANQKVWDKIPASSINYSNSMIQDLCQSPKDIFKGTYVIDSQEEDVVKVYSIFTGLGLPSSRIESLKKETLELKSKVKIKDDARNLTLNLDTGKNDTISVADKIKEKIAAKNSTFGKFVTGVVSDRRK